VESTENLEAATGLVNDADSISEALENHKEMLSEFEDFHIKIKTSLNSSHKKKLEIDALYSDIFGYKIEADNEEDEEQIVEGLKSELESTYSELKRSSHFLDERLVSIRELSENSYQESLSSFDEKFDTFIEGCNLTFNDANNSIKRLLPNALTAGLSSAYGEKREGEETSQVRLEKSFGRAIMGLVAISIIPFSFDAYMLLVQKLPLMEVINNTPKLMLSVFPLYFPVLWYAYSSNKKLNLSKRLVEEYTHKEVLSKTFEGLSAQIENISQKELSEELRTKLLFNILDVNSENPGKLISDYNKVDHPLMDALDKSAKLAGSVEKLSKIPGFSALTKKLDEKAQRILSVNSERIDAVLDDESDKKEKAKTTESG